MAGDFGFGDSTSERIDGGGKNLVVLKREARAFGEDFAALGDEELAVVDDASSFIAEEIGVEIGDAEGARALGDEAAADLRFAKGKVASAGIKDEIDGSGGESCARAVGDPSVFANFKADAKAADVEERSPMGMLSLAK